MNTKPLNRKLRKYAKIMKQQKAENEVWLSELLDLIHVAEDKYQCHFGELPDGVPEVVAVQAFASRKKPPEQAHRRRSMRELPKDERATINKNILFLLKRGFDEEEICRILEISNRTLRVQYWRYHDVFDEQREINKNA